MICLGKVIFSTGLCDFYYSKDQNSTKINMQFLCKNSLIIVSTMHGVDITQAFLSVFHSFNWFVLSYWFALFFLEQFTYSSDLKIALDSCLSHKIE